MSVFGHINKLIAGPLFAIFLALIFGALTVFGVINMTFGHLLLFAAWLVGGILIATEILPGKPAKHKIPIILLLGVAILGLDRWVVSLKAAEEAKKAVTPVAEAQKQTPIQTKTQANASPTASASASPSIVAHASPKPQASPPVSVPINFDRVIFIKSGSPRRLDTLLKAAGYKGSMSLQALYIHNMDTNTDKLYWGQSDMNTTNSPSILPAQGYNFPGGADATQVYLLVNKDMNIYISLRSR